MGVEISGFADGGVRLGHLEVVWLKNAGFRGVWVWEQQLAPKRRRRSEKRC